MFNIFKKFLDYNQKELNHLQNIVEEINQLEDRTRHLIESEFKNETEKLKKSVKKGEKTLDEVLPWAYALVREAARRTLGERHYDVQLMAAIALHQGKVAEQKTGEGKTLSATAPLYLNALTGDGVHLVTVNDYLARRDTGWMGPLFHMLGMTVSAMISDQSYIFDPDFTDTQALDWRLIHLKPVSRYEAYQADITYGINSEFGFDYLRDNMSYQDADVVQRGFNFAIIDEVDSVLIDEARTPHIISAPYDEDTSKYHTYAQVARQLSEEDFVIDEKARTVHLTEVGILKIEKTLGTTNIYEKDFDTLFHTEAALKAKTLFKKDKDYIVKDGEVVIVDEFTGRLLSGRRFSEGLHQAIEAKEGVSVKRESKTLATVSLQNYFRMYKKLAGMTGTAATEAEEFHKIYMLDVIVVPTHNKMVRKDNPDLIYKTEGGKFRALVEKIAEEHATGRPILVGTTSIEKNEILSNLLKKKGIKHELLNAKNHEREASIIANAGRRGAVTVATNMAGRGVDIILGGETPSKYQVTSDPPASPDGSASGGRGKKQETNYEKKMNEWRKVHDEVISVGGLLVIGTERHESRRIDNQLRGRSGRQGDPGETRFFVSLEDDMMRIFGGEQVSKLMSFFKIPEDQPLEHAMVSKALEQAQVKVEGFNFDIRKHLVDFDDVLNKQREIVYRLRNGILKNGNLKNYATFKENLFQVFEDEIVSLINLFYAAEGQPDLNKLVDEFVTIIDIDKNSLIKKLDGVSSEKAQEMLLEILEKHYLEAEKKNSKELWIEILKSLFLSTIDKYWTEHLTAIEDLREGINLRGYAQLDPLVEYKNEAYSMFERLLSDINYELTRRILKIEIVGEKKIGSSVTKSQMTFKSASTIDPFDQKELPHLPTSSGEESGVTTQPEEIMGYKIKAPGTKSRNLGRNDPCWCGSGKKYKRCHYPD